MLGGELLRPMALARAVAQRSHGVTGEAAVGHHQPVDQQVLDLQLACQRLGDVVRRTGQNGHDVSRAVMLRYLAPSPHRSRPHARREPRIAQLLHLVVRLPAHPVGVAREQDVDVEQVQPVQERVVERPDQIGRRFAPGCSR